MQQNRENKWRSRIKRSSPAGEGLIIAGREHMTGGNQNYPFIGRVPEMLEELGIDFELLADLNAAN